MWVITEPFFLASTIRCTLNSPLAFQNWHSSKHLRVKNSFGEMLEEQISAQKLSQLLDPLPEMEFPSSPLNLLICRTLDSMERISHKT